MPLTRIKKIPPPTDESITCSLGLCPRFYWLPQGSKLPAGTPVQAGQGAVSSGGGGWAHTTVRWWDWSAGRG